MDPVEAVQHINICICALLFGAFGVTFAGFKKIRASLLCSGVGIVFAVQLFTGCMTSDWEYGSVRFQGTTGACAPYALAKYLEITEGGRMTDAEVLELYDEARSTGIGISGEPGVDMGVMMYVAERDGLIGKGVQLYSSEDIKAALSISPVVLSYPVFTGGRTWGTQFVSTEGEIVGRHAALCIGHKGGLFTLLSSYGQNWGSNGRIWLWESDLEMFFGLSPSNRAQAWIVK